MVDQFQQDGLAERGARVVAGRPAWQISAGDTNRNYARLCLERGLVLFGPGALGPWSENDDSYVEQHPTQVGILRRFAQIPPGDVVVLRMGQSRVYGVGVIVGPYLWSDEFGDVDGWNVQHIRRVHWLWQCGADGPQMFADTPMNRGQSVQRLYSQEVAAWIAALNLPFAAPPPELLPLPGAIEQQRVPAVGTEEIRDALFDRGVASAAIDALVTQIDDLVRLSRWYEKRGVAPSEQETIVHLVAPLLRALGWTPQRIALQLNYSDIALFRDMPREPPNLVMVIEAKAWQRSCLSAAEQARGYAEHAEWANCRRMVVTDGVRFGVWVRDLAGFGEKPNAYLNLARMVADYPALGFAGALQALHLMSPDWAG